MPKIKRLNNVELSIDFSDLDFDVSGIIDQYLTEDSIGCSVYEMQRILVDGIAYEVRAEQATRDENFCDSSIGDLPCGSVAEFVMDDGTKVCFECYRLYLQRFGRNTGKSFKEIN